MIQRMNFSRWRLASCICYCPCPCHSNCYYIYADYIFLHIHQQLLQYTSRGSDLGKGNWSFPSPAPAHGGESYDPEAAIMGLYTSNDICFGNLHCWHITYVSCKTHDGMLRIPYLHILTAPSVVLALPFPCDV